MLFYIYYHIFVQLYKIFIIIFRNIYLKMSAYMIINKLIRSFIAVQEEVGVIS